MTPGELDFDVIALRLRLMRELLEDLESLGQLSAATLRSDRIRRRAAERILTQLVDEAVSINGHLASTELNRAPDSYRHSFELAAQAGVIGEDLTALLRPSVGLRNVLVHEYVEADLNLVAHAASVAGSQYGRYADAVAAWTSAKQHSRQESNDSDQSDS